ncbi:BTB/POZ domain-containing protein 6-like [Gigantopelta aegis]|uniref:BTB/POZ domain-containing protein 6-like n=1 Tax=Gigantopelta aegis TaxID=1735272 RepID=UPI001B88D7F9|nr:BTB/POZ domain-containing protein 6-like [Gigantopelta aegis]XP_041356596.1 BTB/POZ domain-containing protein 6-like [Gigantopelta aegis]
MATKESKSKVQSGFVDNWQKGKSVTDSLSYSLEEKILCDVTFMVGENRKRIQAHRLILSLRSCVFLAMLTGPLAEQDNIEIPDIDPDVFDQFLKFLYTDDTFIDGRNVIGLLYASKKYDIVDLEKKCLNYMESSLTTHDVCTVMEQSHLYNEEDLMKQCLKYIWQNGDAVLKSDSFCNLCHDCFTKIIKADELEAGEASVFEASIYWSDAECRRQGREVTPENRRNFLGESIYLIRYSILDPKYFDQNVSPTRLLTETEEIKILRSYIFPDKDVSPFTSKTRSIASKKQHITVMRFDEYTADSLRRSGNCDEGIMFSLNTSAELQGLRLYGSYPISSGPLSYDVKTSVCDVLTDTILPGSSISKTISSHDVIYDVDFPSPIPLVKKRQYNLIVRIKGTTFRGENGKSSVRHGSFTCSFFDYKQCRHSSKQVNHTTVATGPIAGLKLLI